MLIWRLLRRVLAHWQVRQDAVGYARSLGVSIGEGSEIFSTELNIFGGEPYMVRLGRRCFITEGVRFVTHDGGVLLFRSELPDLDLIAPIVLGDDVYVGTRAILLPGTTVGSNCVIGAGSVVRGKIPSGSVVGGVPARVLKSIDEYRAGLVVRGVPCGRMTPAAKRLILERHFGIPGDGKLEG